MAGIIDWIKGLIEWVANDAATALAGLFPLLVVGLLMLYLAWIVIGYLRVSQVGREAELLLAGHAERVPRAPDGVLEVEPGIPYREFCGLRYPAGALFCVRCEGELTVGCTNCGARVRPTDDLCLRCGTPQRAAAPVAALPGQHA